MKRSLTGPRMLVAVLLVAVVTVLLVAFWWRSYAAEQDRKSCERSVAVREDNRAMWEWLISKSNQSNPLVIEGRDQLDRRLPHLRCDSDLHPVPVQGEG